MAYKLYLNKKYEVFSGSHFIMIPQKYTYFFVHQMSCNKQSNHPTQG